MVYDPNANWTAATAKRGQAPRYFATFEGVPDTLFSTGRIKSATTRNIHRLLEFPSQVAQKLSQSDGRASISSVELRLLDDASGTIRNLLTEQPIRTITLQQTIEGPLAECEFDDIAVDCSGRVEESLGGATNREVKMFEGATPGTQNFGNTIAASEQLVVDTLIATPPGSPGLRKWHAGQWTVNVRIGTGQDNTNITLEEVTICRVASGCASHVEIGKTVGLGIVWSPAGVTKTVLVDCIESQGPASDLIAIPLVWSNAVASTQGGGVRNQETVATPLGPSLFPITNAQVSIFAGYEGLAEADYAEIFRGQITNLAVEQSGKLWRVTVSDFKRQAADEIFTNADNNISDPFESEFGEAATVGDGVFAITDPGQLKPTDNIFLGPSTAAGFIDNEEVVEVRADPRPRGGSGDDLSDIFIAGQLVNDYEIGDPIRWATSEIEGNPVNIMYAILTGDFTNGTFPVTTKGAPTGLGILPADINSANFQDARDTFIIDEVWKFIIKEPVTGFRFLEAKLFRWLGYPRILGDGRLGFRAYGPPTPADAVAGLPTIVKADVLKWGVTRALNLHFNKFTLGLDDNAATGAQQVVTVVSDTDDQDATKEIREIKDLKSGLRSNLFGTRVAGTRLDGLLKRFGEAPFQYHIETDQTRKAIEVGDVIELTHPLIPNFADGTLGVTDLRLEVVQRAEDFAAAKIKWIFQDANHQRASWIGNTAVEFGAATDAQKEHAFIAPNAEGFADGSPPYRIT